MHASLSYFASSDFMLVTGRWKYLHLRNWYHNYACYNPPLLFFLSTPVVKTLPSTILSLPFLTVL